MTSPVLPVRREAPENKQNCYECIFDISVFF